MEQCLSIRQARVQFGHNKKALHRNARRNLAGGGRYGGHLLAPPPLFGRPALLTKKPRPELPGGAWQEEAGVTAAARPGRR